MEQIPGYGVTAICESPDSKELTLNEYQRRAMTTCMESCDNHAYMLMGFVGEVGELFGKIAKHIRKQKAEFYSNDLLDLSMTEQEMRDLKAELGDCQWFIAGIAAAFGWKLDEIGRENLAKLSDRQNRGVISGDGDNR